jgi:hypothetical protein
MPIGLNKAEELISRIEDMEVATPVMREYDDAMIGLTHDLRAVYSADGIRDILVNRDGMTRAEAVDWIMYNIEPLCDTLDRAFVLVWGP